MSLIQAALDKTQNKISSPPEKKPADLKTKPRVADALTGLGALDREVEKKILETQKRAAPDVAPQRNYKLPIFSFVLLGLLFTAGIFYWSQNRMAIEPEPPLVVDIERSPATQYHAPAMPVKTESIVSVKPFDFQSHFQLNGIVWDIQSPMALINGRIVKAGDWLDNRVIVKEIGRDSATLDRGGEAFVLKLKV